MNKRRFWGVFLIGLVIKLVTMPLASSDYTHDLFIPFLDASIQSMGTNPWTLSPPQNFPYGAILYAILVWPKAIAFSLVGDAALGSAPLSLLLYKLPILLIDVLLFFALLRRFSSEPMRLLGFYWFNPVLFYVNYCLGHVDLISMAFVTFSCFALFDRRILWSGVFAGCALASKFHTALAFPLIFLYIWRNEFWPMVFGKMSLWFVASLIIAAVGLYFPYQAGYLKYVTFGSPEAFRIFSFAISFGEGLSLYLGFALVLVVQGRLMATKKLTEQGLFFGLGILFQALLLVTNPMPSWFAWLMPFSAVFMAQFRLIHWLLPLSHSAFYFIYFVVLPTFFPSSMLVTSVALTTMQATVAAQLALMWYFLVKREFPLSARLKPLIIGIAGDSGAGKNRFSDSLSSIFDVRKASFVEGDDYHRWERGHDNWKHLTHLSPRANYLDTLSYHTFALSSGRSVLQPHYDHSVGRFTHPRLYKPSQTIIVQGLHTLYPKSMRDAMDLKVFIKPDPLVRLSWKIKRDVLERKHSTEKVLSSIQVRESDGLKYIEPQRLFADWIIEAVLDQPMTREEIIAGIEPKLKFRHLLWNDCPVNPLMEALKSIETLDVKMDALEGDIDRIILEVSGSISSSEVSNVAHDLFPMLRSLTRATFKPKWLNDFDGINQLIALSLLSWQDTRGSYT